MKSKMSQIYCPNCRKVQTFRRNYGSNIEILLHIIITIMTGGLWTILMLIIKRQECWVCGLPKKNARQANGNWFSGHPMLRNCLILGAAFVIGRLIMMAMG